MSNNASILLIKIIGIILILLGLLFIPAVVPAVILLPAGTWLIVYGGKSKTSDRSWLKRTRKMD